MGLELHVDHLWMPGSLWGHAQKVREIKVQINKSKMVFTIFAIQELIKRINSELNGCVAPCVNHLNKTNIRKETHQRLLLLKSKNAKEGRCTPGQSIYKLNIFRT